MRRRQGVPDDVKRHVPRILQIETAPEVWIDALRNDACAYCGKAGGNIDHIIPKVRRGPNTWWNVTGSCRRCNVAKAGQKLLQFLIGGTQAEPTTRGRPGTLLDVPATAANLREIPLPAPRPKDVTGRLLEALLDGDPNAQVAVLYGLQWSPGGRRYLHVVRTTGKGPHAGELCEKLGGGGGRYQGGFTSTRIEVTDATEGPGQKGAHRERPQYSA